MATYYVSKTAANGIPAGSDSTGDGSQARPWASVDRANAAAADGDTVFLNDGVYTPAGDLVVTNSVSWQSVRDYGATLRAAAGETRIVTVSDDRAGSVTFGKLILDGANMSRSLIQLGDLNVPYSLTLNGTRLVNPTSFGIQGGASTRANVTTNGVEFTASSALSMVYMSALNEGGVAVYGGKVSIAGQPLAGYGGVVSIDADAVGPTVTVSGVKADIVSTGGVGIHYGIRLKDVAKAVVEYNDITQTGAGTDFIGATVHVSYERVAPLNASGGVVRYNTLRNYLGGAAGKIILVGADSDPGVPLQDNANDFEIYGNSLFGNAASQAGDVHGILVGWQDGAKVYNNSVDYTTLAYVLKGMSGDTQVYNNLATRTLSKAFYQKGGTGVDFLYNYSYNKESFKPVGIAIGDLGVNEFPALDATVVGNLVYYSGSPGIFMSMSPGSNIAALQENKYYGNGSTAFGAWQYDGTQYTTLAAWQAAREGSATWAAGATLGMGTILGAISLSGPGLTEGGMVGNRHTYYVTFVNGVASSASFAVANLGVTGAAKVSGRIDVNDSGGNITSPSLSGSGTVDTLYGPLSPGARKVFTVNYDGQSSLNNQVLSVLGSLSTTPAYNIVFRTVDRSAPTIAGVTARTMNDVQTVSPFSGVTVTDVDVTGQHRVTVGIGNTANGTFSALAGFTSQGGGEYLFVGTNAQANAALQKLRFTPTADQVTPGQTVTTGFSLRYDNGAFTATDTATVTTAASINDAPVVAGVIVNQATTERTALRPFATTTLVDPDVGQDQTVTITLDKVTRGQFTTLAGFTDNADGSLRFIGPAASAQSALQNLVFKPNEYQAAPGSSTTAKMTLVVSDGVVAAKTQATYVAMTAVNTAPVVSGAATSSIADTATVNPFAAMTVADPDKNAVEAVTVQLDLAIKGAFTTLAGFTAAGDGKYTFSGSPGSAQSALQRLVFKPTAGRLVQGQTEAVGFSVTLSDGTASAFDGATSVLVSGTRVA